MQSVPAILWPFLLALDKNEVGIEDGLPTYKWFYQGFLLFLCTTQSYQLTIGSQLCLIVQS